MLHEFDIIYIIYIIYISVVHSTSTSAILVHSYTRTVRVLVQYYSITTFIYFHKRTRHEYVYVLLLPWQLGNHSSMHRIEQSTRKSGKGEVYDLDLYEYEGRVDT